MIYSANQKRGMEMQDCWQRRHAIQIAAALPENIEDALLVLALATELVSGFLAGKPIAQRPLERDRGNVVSLSSSNSGASFSNQAGVRE